MTRSTTVLAFAFLGAVLIITSAWARADESTGAKPSPAGVDSSSSPAACAGVDLLRNDRVRSDLRISGEQEQQLITLSVNEGQNLKDLRKKAVAILTPQQRERLQQLHLQSMGPAALGDLAVVKALKYTPEQRKMVKTLPGQVRRATLEALEGAQTARDRIEKRTEVQERIFKEAFESLTPEQREKFEKMRGPKINVDFTDFPQ